MKIKLSLLATAISLLTTNAVLAEPLPPTPPIAQFCQILSPNSLSNATFDQVGPLGASTQSQTMVPGTAGASAAANWGLFTNTPGKIASFLAPSTRDDSMMIGIETGGNLNGLVQTIGPMGSGASKAVTGAWVFVDSGRVCLGTGNGGLTECDRYSSKTGEWELVSAINGTGPANEVIVYSVGDFGANFFVDEVYMVSNPKNLLSNASLDLPGPQGGFTNVTTTVPGTAGWSAADSWALFTNHPGMIESELLPSTRVQGSNMLRVSTDADRNGALQLFSGCDTDHVVSGAWVFVVQGSVCLGTGNGGDTSCDTYSTTTNQWEWLEAPNGRSPANELIIYAMSNGGAEYYIDSAETYEIPVH